MRAGDILKPRTKEEIQDKLSIWYHINSTTPTLSLFIFLRAGLLWVTFFLTIATVFIAAFLICLVTFGWKNFNDKICDIVESKFFDKFLNHQLACLIIKYGKIVQF